MGRFELSAVFRDLTIEPWQSFPPYGSFAPAITVIGFIYLLGLALLIYARETKGQPLPAITK